MNNKTLILLALIALFSSTVNSKGFLGFPRKLQDIADPLLITSVPPLMTPQGEEGTSLDSLLFGGNEEEMSLEEGEFSNEEGEFSNEEGEFSYSEEEMILIGAVGDEIPIIPALSSMNDDDMLGGIWIGVNEEEMSFEESEFSNEEGEFSNEEGEFSYSEEEMILIGAVDDEIPIIPALSNMNDDDMLGGILIGVSEEEMSFEEGEFTNEEGELTLGEGEFGNEEAEFSFSDLGFTI